MYNLLVSSLFHERQGESLAISKSRFLEHTNHQISDQLSSLSAEALEAIKSWPCLVMEEGRGDEKAAIARIDGVMQEGADLLISVTWIPTSPEIFNADLFRIRDQLDIGQFEFSRHHWAVKDRDLLKIIGDTGIQIVPGGFGNWEQLPLPTPNRGKLIEARNIIGDWGHTEIDDLLLEAGVEGLRADRDVGSQRDRANAIIKFALENPSVVTAENSLLSAYIVRRALPQEPDNGAILPTGACPPQQSSIVTSGAVTQPPIGSSQHPNRVFVVHGRNDGARDEVVQFLRNVGLVPIVLHEQPNMGRHLLTKFVEEAELVTFALILMMADDVGGLTPDELRPRARQNVILELGYFLSHLGQPRVCALISPGLETPSDFDGIVYIRMADDNRWQQELLRELRAAQMPVRD